MRVACGLEYSRCFTIKRKDLWWKGKQSVGRSFHKRRKPPLHFRNIVPGQMRPKGTRKENKLRMYNGTSIDWTWAGQPCLADWSENAESLIIKNTVSTIGNGIDLNICSTRTPSYIFYDDAAYLELNGTIREMAHTRGNTGWDDIDNSHIVETIQHTIGREYWLGAPAMSVSVGQIIEGSGLQVSSDAEGYITAQYIGVVDGNHSWRATRAYNYTPSHQYKTVWEQVKDWVSDDGLITAEDYYRRVTGHVLFNPCFFEKETSRCNANTYVFQNKAGDMEFFRQDWVYQSKAGIRCIQEKIEWSLFPQFIITLEYSHKWGQFTGTVQHKTDRDGPCGTCRGLMEQVPVDVGGILL